MKLVLFAIFISLIVIYFSINIQESFKTIEYKGSIQVPESEDNVEVNNVKVSRMTKTNKLSGKYKTLETSDFDSITEGKLPLATGDKICIDSFANEDTSKNCLTKDIVDVLTNNKIEVIETVKIRVKSSGLVSNVLGGMSEFYINGEKVKNINVGRGLNVLVVNNKTLDKQFRRFDTHDNYDNTKEFINFINQIPNDHYVAVSAFDEAINKAVPKVSVYDGKWSQGWAKHYKIKADGTDTDVVSTWEGNEPTIYAKFPDNEISSVRVHPDLKATFYEHEKEVGEQIIVEDEFKTFSGTGMNDTISSFTIQKRDPNSIISPFEALKSCGGAGNVIPNYRGSYIFIGIKGSEEGTALEKKKDSNSDSTNSRTLDEEKELNSNNLFISVSRK